LAATGVAMAVTLLPMAPGTLSLMARNPAKLEVARELVQGAAETMLEVEGPPAPLGLDEGFKAGAKATGRALRKLDSAGTEVIEGVVKGASNSRIRSGPNVPEHGTFFVDSGVNVIPTPPGGKLTGSKDGIFIQARDASGAPTGVRIDGPHLRGTHADPRALRRHAHVPGVTNPDGTPWLPLKEKT